MPINSITGNTLLNGGAFSPCRAASTGAPLSLSVGGLLVVDGVQLIAGDRVLCKDEASAVNNGIYAANTGPWVRTTDAAGNTQFFDGMKVTVAQGALNGGQDFICTCTDDPVVVGTSFITFASQQAVATAMQAATSATSLAIGTGSKTLTIQSGKGFQVNQWVLIQETSTPANQMLGQIASYAGTSLSVNVTATGGSGTHADWTIVLTNSAAAAGYQPPVGSGNTTGPGSATAGHVATFADSTGKVLADGGAQGALAALSTLTGQYLAQSAAAFGLNMLNGTVAASVGGSALTLAIKTIAGNDPSASDPVWFIFRSATIASGALTVVAVTAALSVTVPSGATLGFANGTPGRVWLVAVYDSGVVSLAVINCLSGTNTFPLAGAAIAAVSQFSGGANLARVFYGAAAHSSVPYAVLGFATYEAGGTLGAAGTWNVAPTRIEVYRPGVPLPGQVLQVAQSAFGTGSLAITPSSSANLVKFSASATIAAGPMTYVTTSYTRGSTLLASTASGGNGNGGTIYSRDACVLIDNPATLSAVTYSITSSGNVSDQSVTLEEIVA